MSGEIGKKEKWQEIANRGLQDNFDSDTRVKFDEAVSRGLISLPESSELEVIEPVENLNPSNEDRLSAALKGRERPNNTLMDRSAGSRISSLLQGGADLGLGAAQLGANIQGAAVDAIGLPELSAAPYANDFIDSREEWMREGREATDREGFDAARLGGNIFTGGVASKGLDMGAKFIGKLLKGGRAGAGFGASAPVEGDDYWGKKAVQTAIGAGTGVALPVVGEAVRATGRGARNVVQPWVDPEGAVARSLNTLAGDKKTKIVELLRENKQLPGGKAGAGEVAAPAGRVEFSGGQRIAEKSAPSDYKAMSVADDEARKRILGDMAGTEAERASAEGVRSGNASANYKQAFEDGGMGDVMPENVAELRKLAKNPYFKKAQAAAGDIAKSKGINPKDNFMEYMHQVKKSMDDALFQPPKEGGLAPNVSKEVLAVRARLIEWLRGTSDDYKVAMDAFKDDSKLVNQQKLGKYLYEKLVSPIDDVTGDVVSKQRFGQFAQAQRDAAKTVKKSSGNPVTDRLDEIATPEQMKGIESINSSLGRRSAYEGDRMIGAKAAEDAISSPQLPATGPIDRTYMIIKTAFNRLQGQITDPRTMSIFSDVMKNPQRAADLLEGIPSADKGLVYKALKEAGSMLDKGLPKQETVIGAASFATPTQIGIQ